MKTISQGVVFLICLGCAMFAFSRESATEKIGVPVFASGIGPEPLLTLTPFTDTPRFFDHGNPSAPEQFMLELINRARANPAAEANRFGIDLNQGLDPGSISASPKQPLASHPALIDAARNHSQWMLDTDVFSHTGIGGSSHWDRMSAAGYPFGGSWASGENISRRSTTGTVPLTEFTEAMHRGLFESPGHRVNLLKPEFEEIGIGLVTGQFFWDQRNWNTLMGTQKFARSASTAGPLLVGVVYEDQNGNGFYDPGEGVANITVQLDGGSYHTVTAHAGGFALPYAGTGETVVTFSGGSLPGPVRKTLWRTGENLKLDLVITDDPPPSKLLTVTREGSGSGAVISHPAGIDCGDTCAAAFGDGATITLGAVPAVGSTFTGWSGACSGLADCTVILTQDRHVTATFAGVDAASGDLETLQQYYLAYYGRPADLGGLSYWLAQVQAAPDETARLQVLDVVRASFGSPGQPEFLALYGAEVADGEFFDRAYRNLLNRDETDPGARTYWLGVLSAQTQAHRGLGRTAADAAAHARADVLSLMIDAVLAAPGGGDHATFRHKIDAALYATDRLAAVPPARHGAVLAAVRELLGDAALGSRPWAEVRAALDAAIADHSAP